MELLEKVVLIFYGFFFWDISCGMFLDLILDFSFSYGFDFWNWICLEFLKWILVLDLIVDMDFGFGFWIRIEI